MKKYFVVYKAPAEEFKKAIAMSPEERKKFGDEWMAWMQKHKDDIVDGGAPVGKTKEVSAVGVADIKNDIGAFGIVQAQDHEAAAKIFTDSPHLSRLNGTIEVMEILQM